MNEAPAPAPGARPLAAPAPRPPRRRLLLRSSVSATFSLLLVAALLAATAGWLVAPTSGMSAVIAFANRFAPVRIDAHGSFGALTGEFGFAELKITAGNTVVDLTAVRGSPEFLTPFPAEIWNLHVIGRATGEAGTPHSTCSARARWASINMITLTGITITVGRTCITLSMENIT